MANQLPPFFSPRFFIKEMKIEGVTERPAALGLFVVMCIAQQTDPDRPKRPEDSRLAFVGFSGFGYSIDDIENPWPLLGDSRECRELRKKTEQLQLQRRVSHFFCAIAHPDPNVARQVLERARNGDSLPWQKFGPNEDAFPSLELSNRPNDFLPGGPNAYGGWLLYPKMPYFHLKDARNATQKLAVHLAQLGFPTGGMKKVGSSAIVSPYPKDESEHDGGFGSMLHSTLRRFQEMAEQAQAARIDATSRKPGQPSWEPLLATAVSADQPLKNYTPGVVDQPTADCIDAWLSSGLRSRCTPLVEYNQLWGRPELWWRHWALERLCDALGALYPPQRGSSFRHLASPSDGQAKMSKHHIGMAFDLDANSADPSEAAPFGVEGRWFEDSNRVKARFNVFLHSRKPSTKSSGLFPSEIPITEVRTALRRIPEEIEEKMREHMLPDSSSDPLPARALGYIALLRSAVEKLADPASESELTSLYQGTIRRFQWREDRGGNDFGDVQPPVNAQQDATALGAKWAHKAATWLNLSRVAHLLELDRISTDSMVEPANYSAYYAQRAAKGKSSDPYPPTLFLSPGQGTRFEKATVLDRIAQSIKAAAAGSEVRVYDRAYQELRERPELIFHREDFDLDVIENWIWRPTDPLRSMDPSAARPPSPPPPGFDYRPDGIDLRVPIYPKGTAEWTKALEFFATRSNVKALVMGVGPSVAFAPKSTGIIKTGAAVTFGQVEHALIEAFLEPATADTPDIKHNQIWLRPLVVKDLDRLKGHRTKKAKHDEPVDPGYFYFEVHPRSEPKGLEWWHYELPWATYPGQDYLSLAHELGYSRTVLEALPIPVSDSPPSDGVWTGGLGLSPKPSYGRPEAPATGTGWMDQPSV